MRRRIVAAAKIVLTLAALVVVFTTVDVPNVIATGKRVTALTLIAAMVFISLQNVLAVLRWYLISRTLNINLELSAAFRVFFIALFANQVLPSSIGGDVVRVWLTRNKGNDLSASITSIILDRIMALLGLIALVLLTQPLYWIIDSRSGYNWTLSAGLVFFVFLALALAVLGSRIPIFGVHKILRDIQRTVALVGQYVRSPRDALLPTGSSFLGFVLMCAIVALFLGDVGGRVSFWQCLVLLPPVFLLASLPISIAGWGVREGGMLVALGYAGVPAELALSSSIFLGLVVLVGALPGAVLLWSSRRLNTAQTAAKT